MHIFTVLNWKFEEEAKDNHVKKVNLVKHMSGGDAMFVFQNKTIYEIGTKIPLLQ